MPTLAKCTFNLMEPAMNKRSFTVASPLLALSLLSVSGADLAVCNATDPARCCRRIVCNGCTTDIYAPFRGLCSIAQIKESPIRGALFITRRSRIAITLRED
jgi:hypothetical protein